MCNKNDEVTNELNGQWNLISCLCQPIDLKTGEHLYNFDINNSELNVVNNVTE